MFELEGSYAWHASALAIGLPSPWPRTGVAAFWLLCVLALAGVFTAVRPGGAAVAVGVPLLYALSIVFVNVETPRFREPIDPFLMLLAACASATAARRVLGAAQDWAVRQSGVVGERRGWRATSRAGRGGPAPGPSRRPRR